MPLPDFADEAQFRSWLAPFLSKLGYILPKIIHGEGEQGKDLYFAEPDRFGHLRFLVAQAKYGDIGAGDVELDKLLQQVRRCFTVPIKHQKGAENQRVAAVYIMASGKISARAREVISDVMRQEHYGENVFWLDGDTLSNMDRTLGFQDDKAHRHKLLALKAELAFNCFTLVNFRGSLSFGFHPHRCRISVLEDCLTTFPIDYLDTGNDLSRLWNNIQYFHVMLSEGHSSERTTQSYEDFTNMLIRELEGMQQWCDAEVAKLDAKHQLELVVKTP